MLGPPPPVLLLLWRQELPLLLWLSVLPVEQLSGQLASPPADLHEKGLSLSTRNCCEANYLREHRVKQTIKHLTRLGLPPPVLLQVLLLLVWLLLLPFEQPPPQLAAFPADFHQQVSDDCRMLLMPFGDGKCLRTTGCETPASSRFASSASASRLASSSAMRAASCRTASHFSYFSPMAI